MNTPYQYLLFFAFACSQSSLLVSIAEFLCFIYDSYISAQSKSYYQHKSETDVPRSIPVSS
jgi:hypothetical protein